MSRIKMMLSMVITVGLTLALVGMANAAAITCGGCHGTTGTQNPMPNDVDNCSGNARGLHGTHVNYSSATFKKNVASYGKCAYCHTATPTKGPSLTHNNSYVNVTGSDNGGKATNLDYNVGAKTCASACHRSGGATAKWGNYTATTVGGIILTCASCHSDASDNGATLSSPSNYGHKIHLTGSWLGSGANKTIIQVGSFNGSLNSGDNTACKACHPDNMSDLWKNGKADDGSKKAYPHAKDGTNVVTTNAVVGGDTGTTLAAYSTASAASGNFNCSGSCHLNTSAAQLGYARWNGTKMISTDSNCEVCHQHKGNSRINNSATVPLQYAHRLHFLAMSSAAGESCSDCHLGAHNNYAGLAQITKLPVTPGTAGLVAGMNWSKPGTIAVDGTCQNTCHTVTSPAWNSIATNSLARVQGCAACHEYPGGVTDWVANNGHAVKYSAAVATNTHLRDNASYDKVADAAAGVASVESDINKCGRCHYNQGANHRNGSVNVAANGSPDCGGTDFTITVVSTGSNVTCSNVACHSGKDTPNWW